MGVIISRTQTPSKNMQMLVKHYHVNIGAEIEQVEIVYGLEMIFSPKGSSSPEVIVSVTAPKDLSATTVYGPLHIDLNFSGKRFSLKLYSST